MRQITDASGTVLQSYNYDVFGAPTVASPSIQSRFGFTGREYDPETGLYHYRARAYSPLLGRFLQRDPIGFADDYNLYRYVKNNAINFVDPYGLEIERQIYGGNFNPEGSIDASNLSLYILLNSGGFSEEQIMNIALGFTPFGEGQAYSEATYNSFLKVLEEKGIESLQKAQQSIQANLDQDLKDLEYYQNTGGFTSSVEKEIKTFKSQLDAIKDILKGAN